MVAVVEDHAPGRVIVLAVGDPVSIGLFRVIETAESPWGSTDLLGDMLSRENALIDSLLKEVFVVAEHVL